MTDTVEIIPAKPTDAASIASLIGATFRVLPPAEWLVPDPTERVRVLSANFRIYVEHALAYGEVDVTADQTAAAVWFPRDRPTTEPDDYDAQLTAACGRWVDRFRTLDSLFDTHHPSQPHHHLAFLAVRDERQGRGLGSALLDHHHAKLDRQSMPAYLEASSQRSRALYLKHGYLDRGEPFTLPNGAPFWPMWRPPDTTASHERAGRQS